MNPMLKAPGTTRLKLKHDTLLSSFAFNYSVAPLHRGGGGGAPLRGGRASQMVLTTVPLHSTWVRLRIPPTTKNHCLWTETKGQETRVRLSKSLLER
jgi:hypothetical protein